MIVNKNSFLQNFSLFIFLFIADVILIYNMITELLDSSDNIMTENGLYITGILFVIATFYLITSYLNLFYIVSGWLFGKNDTEE